MDHRVIALALLVATIYVTGEVQETESGLKIEFVEKPAECEKAVVKGQQLTMHYTGTLEDGTKFDSSRDRNDPFKFQIGIGQVIKGWDEGIIGMCVGEKSRIVVVSEFDYGLTELKKMDRCSVGDHCLNQNSLKMFGYRVTQLPLDQSDLDKDTIIPGGSTLYYDIELIEAYYPPMNTMSPYFRVPHVHAFEQIFKSIDKDGDSALSREKMSVHFKKEHKSSNEDFFNSEDKDKDGYISLEEYLDFPRDPYGSKHDEL